MNTMTTGDRLNVSRIFSSTNGKHKDWDDVLVLDEDSPDVNVPILVIGTKQVFYRSNEKASSFKWGIVS